MFSNRFRSGGRAKIGLWVLCFLTIINLNPFFMQPSSGGQTSHFRAGVPLCSCPGFPGSWCPGPLCRPADRKWLSGSQSFQVEWSVQTSCPWSTEWSVASSPPHLHTHTHGALGVTFRQCCHGFRYLLPAFYFLEGEERGSQMLLGKNCSCCTLVQHILRMSSAISVFKCGAAPLSVWGCVPLSCRSVFFFFFSRRPPQGFQVSKLITPWVLYAD